MRCKVFFIVFLIFFSMSFVSANGDDGPLIYCGDGVWKYHCGEDFISFLINEQNLQINEIPKPAILLDEEIFPDEFGRVKVKFSFGIIMLLSSVFLLLVLLLLILLLSGNKMIVYE